jgi:tetrahydromethanopterin S-methyltransferase subunit F
MNCTDCEDYALKLEEKDEEMKELEARLAEIKANLDWVKTYVNDIEDQL